MKQKITNPGLASVCEVISARLGLHFPPERWDILWRNLTLASVEFGFANIEEFNRWLLANELKSQEIETLASFLTVSETYFWREPNVFSAITDVVLPEIVTTKKNGERRIRIWSAGCSTGEEPYSLAIAIHRSIPDLKEWKIEILATDVNPRSLHKAKTGIYTQWSFRNCPPWLKEKYFHPMGEGRHKILPGIRKMVHFANLNLSEEFHSLRTCSTQAMDIIFCRNVLMYFSDEWIRIISQNFHQSLQPDGWFVVSSCELSSEVFPQFNPVNFPGAVFYQKGNKGSNFYKGTRPTGFAFDASSGSVPVVHLPLEPWVYRVVPVPEPPPVENLPVEPITITIHGPKPAADPEPGETVAEHVRMLANQGDLPQALSRCNEGIAANKLDIGLYFLRGSILQEMEDAEAAIASIKQAIYLDPDFVMGHFVLGNIYVRQGNPKNAKRYFKNVVELLTMRAGDEILPESDGLPVKYIREIAMANMNENPIQ